MGQPRAKACKPDIPSRGRAIDESGGRARLSIDDLDAGIAF